MREQQEALLKLIEKLPADLQQEVADFIVFKMKLREERAARASQEKDFSALIELADKHDFKSGRTDISSGGSDRRD